MRDREPGRVPEQFHGHVRRCRVACRSVVEGAGPGFHECDQFPRVAGREIRARDQQHRKRSDQSDRREVSRRVVGQVGNQNRVDARHPAVNHDQRVAVGRRLGCGHHADGASAAGAIFDNDRLAKVLGQSGCYLAGQNVSEPTRGNGRDELDGVIRIRLAERRGRRDHAGQRRYAHQRPHRAPQAAGCSHCGVLPRFRCQEWAADPLPMQGVVPWASTFAMIAGFAGRSTT